MVNCYYCSKKLGLFEKKYDYKDGVRIEKYKCFLLGKYKNKNLIVVPSFNFASEGTNVLLGKLLSPFIKNVLEFKTFIVADKVYDFGKIGDLGDDS